MKKIARFVFNFRDSCNMHCPYCYVPFIDSKSGKLEDWVRIVDILSQYSPDIITFGGGDPFRFKDFYKLLEYCRRYSFQIHVDTNGINMADSQIYHIKKLVDLLGMPLDGSAEQHDQLRNYEGHHQIVLHKLSKCNAYEIPVKINTVYFPDRPEQLKNVAKNIQQYLNISQWFIYEYWHFTGINANIPTAHSPITYSDIIELKTISGIEFIHFSSVKERSPAYLFITSCGNAYTIGNDNTKYVELGNILETDPDIVFSQLFNLEEISQRASLKKV